MPTYEYECRDCGHTFQRMTTFAQHERRRTPRCPKCESRRVAQRVSTFQAVTGKKS